MRAGVRLHNDKQMPLYHFTDPQNLPCIRRIGLLSWHQLGLRDIDHFPASNELSRDLDAAKDLEDYVRLCRRPDHPMATCALMEERISDVVWLIIDDSVIGWRETLFSDSNATANYATINNNAHTALGSNDPQAEVLVKGSISPRWITFPPEEHQRYDDPEDPPEDPPEEHQRYDDPEDLPF